ncbi:DUF6480 family protein [Kitasatospora sp. NPDC051853]|uniref:DUF6480 family protein n=1 Tax=Kitasatospora sp. NPDC051853 TaxID=3364058 RepID=UPI0037B18E85
MNERHDPLRPVDGPAGPEQPIHWSTEQILIGGRGAAAGWTVTWQADDALNGGAGLMRLARAGRTLSVLFSHDGAFRHARESGPGTGELELRRDQVLRQLEKPDPDAPQPTETPAAESSTTAGISVPEPPELRSAWGAWPLVLVILLVLCVVVFMVARIFNW